MTVIYKVVLLINYLNNLHVNRVFIWFLLFNSWNSLTEIVNHIDYYFSLPYR